MISARSRHRVALPNGQELVLGERTLVMAILNVTPDSFADGGERLDPDLAIAAALRFEREGADLIDLGGESTRPGADPLPEAEEWRRVAPVLEGLRGRLSIPVSIDTYKASTAARAVGLGAAVVNDISGFTYEPELAGVVARTGAAAVLMHNRGRSKDIYAFAMYRDVMSEVVAELRVRVDAAVAAGVPRDRLIVDPGYGFAKRAEHSLEALARIGELAVLGLPFLSGPSRKSFLKVAAGHPPAADVPPVDRVWATAAAVTASILGGAHLVRVHDVAAMVQVARTADAVRRSGHEEGAPAG